MGAEPRMVAVGDSYDGYDTKTAEQLREDQCLAGEALRKGGPKMYALAQEALALPPDQLHKKLERDLLNDKTPLHQAYRADSDSKSQWVEKVQKQGYAWSDATSGLKFYPGAPRGETEIFNEIGLLPWLWQSYSNPELEVLNPFWDSSPTADAKTKTAALAIGDPQYTSGGTPKEREAWALWKKNSGKVEPNQFFVPRVFADDARIFLASGGFPRTAPALDTPEYRIAVEDLKTRFASCAWHDPIDPNRVLGKEVAQASVEWQQEITSQATQRQQILGASATATKALQDGTFALGLIVGQSWLADYYTRWQDYWSSGGLGWIGDSYVTIEVPGAKGQCLDVETGGTTSGVEIQTTTCNGASDQKWTLEGSADDLHLRNVQYSSKCLDVAGNASANGTKIQISDCYKSKGQSWKGDVRAASPLKSISTGKCLDLSEFTTGTDARLWDCKNTSAQKFLIKPSGHEGTDSPGYPDKAQFDQAKKGVTDTQTAAKKYLATLKTQLENAKKSAVTSDAAEQAAYAIADKNGAPRGRGLIVGQQKAQVTKGTVAALTAMVKAGETAEAATRASAGDSETIAQRALAQAAQVNAEFRKEAARKAELQAKAAADAAKLHRDNAKKDKETAEAKLALALKAEGDAKTAAADAHAKRLAAEAEEKTAKAEKETAAAKQAEAAQHKQTAQAEAANAQDAKAKAEAAEATAVARKNDALAARDNAREKRDDAWDAEQKAEAARAKAAAHDAYADSLEAGEAADAARAAANEANKHAADAEAAAGRSRSAADAATEAAAEADAAASRAEAAAKRARSHADAAQAAKLRADAAVRTATSAAADAIDAAQHAADEANLAVKMADQAEQEAKTAKSEADEASKEAIKALTSSAKAAGFAHVTAQAAVDAGNAAAQVAKPANDAIQIGSPYITTDSAASLVVLTGQASKTIADQQKAVADAHAKNAQAEAAAAKNLADQASGDTKLAYQYAANAAEHAADARTYSKEALGYAASAAKTAAAASASQARAIEYGQQATADATAADQAAGRAEGYAEQARESADQAALDAQAAREAAAAAEQAAKDARAAADRADAAATEAEQAAKDALKYAQQAQEAADRAEKAANAQQIVSGTIVDADGAIGDMFYVINHIEKVGEPETTKKTDACDNWIDKLFYKGDCTITAKIQYKATLDLYMCSGPALDPTMCPTSSAIYLGEHTTGVLDHLVTHTITMAEYQQGIDPIDILFGSWIKCAQKLTPGGENGSWGGCAWAAVDVVALFAGKIIRPIADAVRAADAAARTGIGFADAFKALRALNLPEAAVASIANSLLQRLRAACKNSFPGTTRVLMADGTTKQIGEIRVSDEVLATDPETGRTEGRTVTDTIYTPDDTEFADITIDAGNARITSTRHHPFWSPSAHRWIDAGDLKPGQSLRTSNGETVTVARIHRYRQLQSAYNLTVADFHTYYVMAGATSVLVHNVNDRCLNPVRELGVSGSASYSRIQTALLNATSRTAAEVRASLSPEQIAAGKAKPFLQRMFYGSSVESAIAADPAILADGNIVHLGNSMPGQAVADFNIAADGKTFGVDITGPSASSWAEHMNRPYITNPYQILRYEAPSDAFLAEVFK
ncbi:polymorphic toxin-type HINT domain-containing protein [Streptomyces sp. NPDC127084]|uniref:polymorphic toxin-type HINT domain-containing protein n=1 Tax=Streptomyces sp. NPDC127084 TaxID=3347133 RepID=UPI00364F9BDE